jgi:hypothetical protein
MTVFSDMFDKANNYLCSVEHKNETEERFLCYAIRMFLNLKLISLIVEETNTKRK